MDIEVDVPTLQKQDGVHLLRSNDDVVEMLMTYLEAAKKHPFGQIGIVMVGYPNIAAIDFAGEVRLEKMLQEGVERLKKRVDASIDEWEFPERDDTLDASYVRYNIAVGPIGFDFLTWLIRSEMVRRKEGAPAPLKVAFWEGKEAEKRRNGYDRYDRVHWMDHVFRPCMGFIGAVEVERALYGRSEPIFVPRTMVEDARKGVEVPMLQPPGGGWPDVVTITLREKLVGDTWRNRLDSGCGGVAKTRREGCRNTRHRQGRRAHPWHHYAPAGIARHDDSHGDVRGGEDELLRGKWSFRAL